MQKVCVGTGAAPLGTIYDVKVVRGKWCLVPDFMSLCSQELFVLPSAALLQSCYYRGHSIDPPSGCCEGRWSVRQCIRVLLWMLTVLCGFLVSAWSELYLGSTEMCQAFGQRGSQQRFCLRILCKNLLGP